MAARVTVPKSWYDYLYMYPDGYTKDDVDLTDVVFYVGKGQRGRIDDHENEAAKGCDCRKCQEIRAVWASGKPIKKRIVFETLVEPEALAREKELIASHWSEHLTNRLMVTRKKVIREPKLPKVTQTPVSEVRKVQEIKEVQTAERVRGGVLPVSGYLTVQETCQSLGVTRQSLAAYVDKGLLTKYTRTLARRTFFAQEEVDELKRWKQSHKNAS
jgi:hypothetical protein